MFMNLAQCYPTNPAGRHVVLQLPAIQLSRWLDEVWSQATLPEPLQGGPVDQDGRTLLAHPKAVAGAAHEIAPSGLEPVLPTGPPAPFTLTSGPLSVPGLASRTSTPLTWHHLIYALLIESTGAFDILAEVARRLVSGDSLGTLTGPSLVWLRNTEELFFRDPPLFSVAGVVSDLRPSAAVGRRNAYWRLCGMDLPHQIPAGWPGSGQPDSWKSHTGSGVNTDFLAKLTELLRQVWMGIENRDNKNGPNPADPDYIALLCQALRDMLLGRRQNGLLAREEFVYVSTMSWFHLTLLDSQAQPVDAPIVRDLQAVGTAPEQRLAHLAQKVGMKPAARARELFLIAEPMSVLLREIEMGTYNDATTAQQLYDGTAPNVADNMRRIINLWQSATGQRIKDRPSVTTPDAAHQPLRAPSPATISTPTPVAAANGNGRGA